MLNPNDSETEYVSKVFVGQTQLNQVFEHIEFDGCVFKECDFSDTAFTNCKFIECEFNNCNLSLLKVNYSRFMDVVFNECKVIGVDWTNASWSNLSLPSPISFQKCVLNDSSFYGLYLSEMTLEECKVHDVDFREGNFNDSNFSSSDFLSSVFSGANLSGVSFEFAENYFIDINNTNIKQAKFSRQEAVCLLESLDIELLD